MSAQSVSNKTPLIIFIFSLIIIVASGSYLLGVYSYKHKSFPFLQARNIYNELRELFVPSDAILWTPKTYDVPAIETRQSNDLASGLILVAEAHLGTRDTSVRVIDRNGNTVHQWFASWNEIWGKEGNFPEERRPRGTGMFLHGLDVLPDGSFVSNFDHLSTFRMNLCGEVDWKLDNLGHHSVFYSDQGYLWVAAEKYFAEGDTGHQNHFAPLRSWSLQKISMNGEILQEIEIIDILKKNDLLGLLYLSNLDNEETGVTGDTLHLNDVDEYPAGMDSEVFKPGDLMVSLRNINALFVFDPATEKINFLSIGRFLRHHDPDFMPGDQISILDNRNLKPSTGPEPLSSRILEIDARDGSSRVVLQGEGDNHFFTDIMGVHQRLDNGNILVNSSSEGRVIEFAPDGSVVWRYDNRLENGRNGRVYMAKILPEKMDQAFFEQSRKSCGQEENKT